MMVKGNLNMSSSSGVGDAVNVPEPTSPTFASRVSAAKAAADARSQLVEEEKRRAIEEVSIKVNNNKTETQILIRQPPDPKRTTNHIQYLNKTHKKTDPIHKPNFSRRTPTDSSTRTYTHTRTHSHSLTHASMSTNHHIITCANTSLPTYNPTTDRPGQIPGATIARTSPIPGALPSAARGQATVRTILSAGI